MFFWFLLLAECHDYTAAEPGFEFGVGYEPAQLAPDYLWDDWAMPVVRGRVCAARGNKHGWLQTSWLLKADIALARQRQLLLADELAQIDAPARIAALARDDFGYVQPDDKPIVVVAPPVMVAPTAVAPTPTPATKPGAHLTGSNGCRCSAWR